MNAVNDAYNGSDGAATIAVYERLKAIGPRGEIALNLLRACKNSERAKQYRGGNSRGSYKRQAYERKDWSIGQLAQILVEHAALEEITWGWGHDANTVGFESVLYVDLPEFGQVSFHNRTRHAGPDYAKPWDGIRGLGASRIIRFACAVLGDPQPPETQGERDVRLKQNGAKGALAPRAARSPRRARRGGGSGGQPSGGGEEEAFFL